MIEDSSLDSLRVAQRDTILHLALSFLQRVSRISTCNLQPNKGRLWRLNFCPHIASKRDTIPWLEIVDVRFCMNAAIVATYYQYLCPRLASIIRHLVISMIVLFNLLARPFYWEVQRANLFHIIPCSLRYTCSSLLAYLPPPLDLKQLTFISCQRSKGTW